MRYLYRVTPTTKILVMIIIAIVTTSKQILGVSVPTLAYLILLATLGGVDYKRLIQDIPPLIPFFVGLPLGNYVISRLRGAEHPGLIALQVLVMLMVLVLLAAMLAYTTNPDDFTRALHKHFHFPYQVAFGIGLAYNILVYMLDKYRRIIEALKSRWVMRSPFDTLRNIIPIIILLLRAVTAKIDALTLAMELKGYGNKKRSIWNEPKMRPQDYILLAVTILIEISILMCHTNIQELLLSPLMGP